MAHHILDKEKCPKCGVPIWYAYSEDARIGFEVKHHTCESCTVLEKETESKSYKRKEGQTPYVVPTIEDIDGEDPFVPTRTTFMTEQVEKAQKALAKKG